MTPVNQHTTTDGSELPDSSTLEWTKSTYSLGNGDCVECARSGAGNMVVRDSKDANGPVIALSADQWRTFVGRVRRGDFDHPIP